MAGATSQVKTASATPKRVWVGRIITALVSALFLFSGIMKFMGGPEMEQGMAKMGLPETMILPLAVVEIACVVIYATPATAVLGAILLTGYLGGAICTHWRVGDLFVTQIVLGVLVWLGIFLRDDRLWSVLPVRIKREPTK